MEELYINVDYAKSGNSTISTHQKGPRSSERRFHGAVVLSLGLLCVFLLAGLIGLGVHYHDSVYRSAAELSAIKANLTERLQASDNRISSLTEERDQLNANLTEMTEELHNLLEKKKTCPSGWKMFSCTCYLLSNVSASWEKGRQDCRNRGADLVVVDSGETQEFLSKLTTTAWIGLNDREEEGMWKWVDGTPLTLNFWPSNQPDNGNGDPEWGEEDCVHTRNTHWNDVSCNASLPWICGKMA